MATAPKLATEILSATGLTCLRVATLAGHANHTRIAIGSIADRAAAGSRIWVRMARSAERIVMEAFNEDRRSRRSSSGLVIEASIDDAVAVLRHFAALNGIAVIEDAQVDVWLASLEHRIKGAIAGMGRAGTLKRLRRVMQFDLPGLLDRQAPVPDGLM